jgi:RNA polymerase sigma factor (sigma-70 family)
MLSIEEEADLFRQLKNGDESARRKILDHHQRLVIGVANKWRSSGLGFMDLYSEGNVALLEALDKFEPNDKYRFYQFARFLIGKAIRRFAEENSVPVQFSRSFRIRKAVQEIKRMERDPQGTPSALDGITLNEQFAITRAFAHATPVYDDAIGGDISSEIDEDQGGFASIGRKILNRESRSLVFELFKTLDNRERAVIEMRYLREPPETYTAIGTALNLSPERARQIHNTALVRMKNQVEEAGEVKETWI